MAGSLNDLLLEDGSGFFSSGGIFSIKIVVEVNFGLLVIFREKRSILDIEEPLVEFSHRENHMNDTDAGSDNRVHRNFSFSRRREDVLEEHIGDAVERKNSFEDFGHFNSQFRSDLIFDSSVSEELPFVEPVVHGESEGGEKDTNRNERSVKCSGEKKVDSNSVISGDEEFGVFVESIVLSLGHIGFLLLFEESECPFGNHLSIEE